MRDAAIKNDTYYWARHQDGTMFVVFHEHGEYYVIGVENAINHAFSPTQIVCPVERPTN